MAPQTERALRPGDCTSICARPRDCCCETKASYQALKTGISSTTFDPVCLCFSLLFQLLYSSGGVLCVTHSYYAHWSTSAWSAAVLYVPVMHHTICMALDVSARVTDHVPECHRCLFFQHRLDIFLCTMRRRRQRDSKKGKGKDQAQREKQRQAPLLCTAAKLQNVTNREKSQKIPQRTLCYLSQPSPNPLPTLSQPSQDPPPPPPRAPPKATFGADLVYAAVQQDKTMN